ncbi:hypothetical protein [Pseudonocardia nigra]|uniref:hypothetical protein n=1 Tax=Pseudonocardia nigra TaxID=1921578 RepID=UPI001C5FB27B|nr:hypothetical protein [Pseudonocardia nigra]
MGLTSLLLRGAARRPHVLMVPAVGGTAARYALEAEVVRRGWATASTPADADLLVVAGEVGPGLAPVVDGLWRQVPAPRARAAVADPARVRDALDAAAALLADPDHQPLLAPPTRGTTATTATTATLITVTATTATTATKLITVTTATTVTTGAAITTTTAAAWRCPAGCPWRTWATTATA